MPTIKGTSSVKDDHAIKKQIKNTKFPKSFSQSVNLTKINIPVLSKWTEERITALLGFEDEIVQFTAINLFLPEQQNPKEKIDPKRAQLNLSGFLGASEAAEFAKELWEMMLDAQTSSHGIPRKLLQEKTQEMAHNNSNNNQSDDVQEEQERPPEMDEWAKEAHRRANRAREAVYGEEGNTAVAARPVSPVPIQDDRKPAAYYIDRQGNSSEPPSRWDYNGRSESSPHSHRRRYSDSSHSSSSYEEDRKYRDEKRKKKKKKRRRSRSRSRERSTSRRDR